jgi:hypothetical protein
MPSSMPQLKLYALTHRSMLQRHTLRPKSSFSPMSITTSPSTPRPTSSSSFVLDPLIRYPYGPFTFKSGSSHRPHRGSWTLVQARVEWLEGKMMVDHLDGCLIRMHPMPDKFASPREAWPQVYAGRLGVLDARGTR